MPDPNEPQAPTTGVTLDLSKSQPLPPAAPAGVTLDMSKSQPLPPVQNVNTATTRTDEVAGAQAGIHAAASTVPGGELVAGGIKGALQSGKGIVDLLSTASEKLGFSPERIANARKLAGVDTPETEALTTPEGGLQKIGSAGEEVAEWMAGDAALEGAAKLLKVAKNAPHLIELIEKFPKASKILMGAGKGAVVGGAQGAVKEGSVEGGVKGAEGGATGGALAETVGMVVKPVAKAFGIGTSSDEDITKAAQFAKNNLNALKDWATAQKPIAEAFEATGEPKTLAEGVEKIKTVRQDYWKKISGIADKHGKEPFNATNVASKVRELADNPALKRFPADRKALVDFANQYTSGSPNFTGEATVGDALKEIKKYNAKLDGEGYWNKSPEARAAMEEANPTIAAWRTASNELRESLFAHLKSVGEPNMEELRNTYGALGNIERSLRGQINVAGRAKNISLKKGLGVMMGLHAGGPAGLAIVAAPILDAIYNDPVAILNRAVSKSAPAGPVKQAIQAGFRAGTPLPKAMAGVAGEEIANSVTFTASDGTVHKVNADQLEDAKKIDPGLKVQP